MSKINTVVFDMDGTLLDTLGDLSNCIKHIQEVHGYPIHSRDEVRMHVGNGIPNLVAKSIPDEKNNPLFESILEEYKAYYQIHCNDTTKPYPGILELLVELKKQNYKVCIVSNKSDPAVKELNEIYFKEYIEVAIGEDEAHGIKKKPCPDTILAALKLLDSKPEESVYVGDSEVDILTANNCGMPCILCEWGFRDKDYLMEEGGKYFAETGMDILKIVENM